MKLVFDKADEIFAATGESHYYRIFPVDNGWVVYIHRFGGEGVLARGVPVSTTTCVNAQAFAQAFEEGTEDLMSARITQAIRVVFSKPLKGDD